MKEPLTYLESLIIAGLRIDGDSNKPDLLVPMVSGERDYPLKNDGRILVLFDPKSIVKAISLAENLNLPDERMKGARAGRVAITYDLPMTLYLINQAEVDNRATIINCLNFLMTLIDSLAVKMPVEYRETLHKFADHLTFRRTIKSFLEEQATNATNISDSLLWCIGAIISQSKWVVPDRMN